MYSVLDFQTFTVPSLHRSLKVSDWGENSRQLSGEDYEGNNLKYKYAKFQCSLEPVKNYEIFCWL